MKVLSRVTRTVVKLGGQLLTCAAFALIVSAAIAQKVTPGKLQIFFVDTEGGQATLFVFPDKTSLLVDTGFPGREGRDATRIIKAATRAGVTKIDYVFLTHYHLDHLGGLTQLLDRISVGTFIDHGENHEPDVAVTANPYAAYLKLLASGAYKRMVVKPGEKLSIGGATLDIVSSDGDVLQKPLPGAGKLNPTCAATDAPPDGDTDPENARSAGFVMTFGKLRILNLGDLTWVKERPLMCPKNMIGHINLLVVSDHGMLVSSSPVLIDGIAPQVAIMDNGERKGGAVRVLDTIRNTPSKPDLWQLHYAMLGGDGHNTNADMIANLLSPAGAAAAKALAAGTPPAPRGGPRPPEVPDEGNMITVEADRIGKFSVTNTRNGQTKQYTAR